MAGCGRARDPATSGVLIMAENFTRAADLIKPDPPKPSSPEWTASADGRTHIMHVLYVAAHGITVGLADHAAIITEQLHRDSLRKIPSQVRVDPGEPDAARAMISRMVVFEQIAGRCLFGSAHGRR